MFGGIEMRAIEVVECGMCGYNIAVGEDLDYEYHNGPRFYHTVCNKHSSGDKIGDICSLCAEIIEEGHYCNYG